MVGAPEASPYLRSDCASRSASMGPKAQPNAYPQIMNPSTTSAASRGMNPVPSEAADTQPSSPNAKPANPPTFPALCLICRRVLPVSISFMRLNSRVTAVDSGCKMRGECILLPGAGWTLTAMLELRVFNRTKNTPVAASVRLAGNLWSRFWGLMGRARLAESHGLLLTPCYSVHTAFMRFPIDVIFVDGDGVVIKVASHLKPFRVGVARGARSALELPAGSAAHLGLETGDRLEFTERADEN